MFKKSLNRSVGGNLLLLAVLILMACFMLLPIVYAVVTAFKPLDEIYIFPPRMYVKKPTLSNFTQLVDILSSSWVPISRYVFNSLFVAAVGVTGHVFMASMAAYPCLLYTSTIPIWTSTAGAARTRTRRIPRRGSASGQIMKISARIMRSPELMNL